ncbi:MAG: arsenate reductase ArsC, partial [Spartobacteria bacterium]
SKPAGDVHPKSIEVMREISIDLSAHHSKHLEEFLNRPVDTVITVCGNADQVCPMFPCQVRRYHWGFSDPAHAVCSEEEVLGEFRQKLAERVEMLHFANSSRPWLRPAA